MKITRTLNVSEKEFYDFLESELHSVIHQSSNEELSAITIQKGLKYSKNEENKNARIDVVIVDYQRGSVYKTRVKSLTDSIEMSYETETVREGLKVIFSQEVESFNMKKHNWLVKEFSEGVYLGRMSELLYEIQKKIIQQRELNEKPA